MDYGPCFAPAPRRSPGRPAEQLRLLGADGRLARIDDAWPAAGCIRCGPWGSRCCRSTWADAATRRSGGAWPRIFRSISPISTLRGSPGEKSSPALITMAAPPGRLGLPRSDPVRRVIVFTRYPEPGKAKTRLIPALGPEGAADLHRAMTRHVLACAGSLPKQRTPASKCVSKAAMGGGCNSVSARTSPTGPRATATWAAAWSAFRESFQGGAGRWSWSAPIAPICRLACFGRRWIGSARTTWCWALPKTEAIT